MKRLRIVDKNDDYYGSDAARIVDVLARRDIVASVEECKLLWQRYSDSMAAGWMMLPEDDDEIYHCVASYFEVIEE
jgi:hypothetical protein